MYIYTYIHIHIYICIQLHLFTIRSCPVAATYTKNIQIILQLFCRMHRFGNNDTPRIISIVNVVLFVFASRHVWGELHVCVCVCVCVCVYTYSACTAGARCQQRVNKALIFNDVWYIMCLIYQVCAAVCYFFSVHGERYQ